MLSSLIEKARDSGFLAVGFSKPDKPLYFDNFSSWISDHKHGDMSWLERNIELREDPSRLLQGCQTIISLAYPYPFKKPSTPDGFTVSRYSQPLEDDYHYRLKTLCGIIVDMIKEMDSVSINRIFVDSAPILERSFAYSGGMGFIGKNNMFIIPGYGSFFYLAEILTTTHFDLSPTDLMENQCGSCTLCIDSCPTGALEKPFYLDASKCLSYLTIEYKGAVNRKNGRIMGDCFFGCDRCQEVCPFNRGEASRQISLLSTDEWLTMEEDDFQDRFGNTTFSRAGLEKIKTNIRAIKD
jgi:epoxyqueuosine reductase